MRKSSTFVLGVYLFAVVISASAQQPGPNYVYDGKTLQVADEDLSLPRYIRWQVWLYEEGVRIPNYKAGLQYSRWGLIEGNSAQNVVERLRTSQNFEAAYLKFFGSDSWGRYTFFNAVGPIAVVDGALEDQPVLEKLYQLRWLHERVDRLMRAVSPSLENNQSEGPTSPVKEYFDQIRDVLQRVSKLQSHLSHTGPQLWFIGNGIAQTKTQVAQAETSVPRITAVLPSVRLPTNQAWMSQAEEAGSDGIVQVEVRETGSGVTVQQSWTGGDGSMTGTVIVTVIPYADIGKIDFEPPTRNGDNRWTVRVQSSTSPFSQTVDSPRRRTARGTFPAVHDATTENSAYFVFQNSAETQDAYAFFLYHKQLGR